MTKTHPQPPSEDIPHSTIDDAEHRQDEASSQPVPGDGSEENPRTDKALDPALLPIGDPAGMA